MAILSTELKVASELGQRLRRWPNSDATFGLLPILVGCPASDRPENSGYLRAGLDKHV